MNIGKNLKIEESQHFKLIETIDKTQYMAYTHIATK